MKKNIITTMVILTFLGLTLFFIFCSRNIEFEITKIRMSDYIPSKPSWPSYPSYYDIDLNAFNDLLKNPDVQFKEIWVTCKFRNNSMLAVEYLNIGYAANQRMPEFVLGKKLDIVSSTPLHLKPLEANRVQTYGILVHSNGLTDEEILRSLDGVEIVVRGFSRFIMSFDKVSKPVMLKTQN